jgi:hypothetical protein
MTLDARSPFFAVPPVSTERPLMIVAAAAAGAGYMVFANSISGPIIMFPLICRTGL